MVETAFSATLDQAHRYLQDGNWDGVLAQQRQARQSLPQLAKAHPEQLEALHQSYGELVNALTAAVNAVVNTDSARPLAQPLRARLCTEMARVLQDQRLLPIAAPAWLPVVEEQLVRIGALFWKERIGVDAEAPLRALELLNRLTVLHEPCPAWVLQELAALRRLDIGSAPGGEAPSREVPSPVSPSVGPPLLPGPPQLAAQTMGLLEARSAENTAAGVELALISLPGRPFVALAAGRLELNIEPWLAEAPEPLIERVVMAFFAGVLEGLAKGEVPQIASSFDGVLDSLQVLWAEGSDLPVSHLAQLRWAGLVWRLEKERWLKRAMALPSPRRLVERELGVDPVRHSGFGSIAVELEAMELAHLQRLIGITGLAAATEGKDPDLEPWAEAVLALLRRTAPWEELTLWGRDEEALWALLPLLQILRDHSGRGPDLARRPDLNQLMAHLRGRRVLLVAPEGPALAKSLAGDGWRGLEPLSDESFTAALHSMTTLVAERHATQPIEWLVVDCGKIRLPLLLDVWLKHGIPGLALSGQASALCAAMEQSR